MRFAFGRRHFVKALGLAPGLVPLLAPDAARAAPARKRLIVIGIPNGVRERVYWPTGTETDWQFPAEGPLGPLLPHKKDLIFMGGLRLQSGWDGLKKQLGGHAALPFLLTGSRGVPGPRISDGVTLSAGGPSVDVFIARELAKRERFRMDLLPLIPYRHSDNDNDGYMSFNGPPIGGKIPNVPTQRHDPVALFNDVFGGGAGDAALAKLRAQRRSVLDFTQGYLQYMAPRVGAEDRKKLEIHADGIRQLEKLLAPLSQECGAKGAGPEPVDTHNINANANMPKVIRAQMDIVTAAMACDLTRVASFVWQNSTNVRWVWSWLGPEFTKPGKDFANSGENMGLRNDHEIAHREGEAEFSPLKDRCLRWYSEQLAYLIEKLKATPDAAGGSLFDNTVILFAHMQRSGGGHQTNNLPWIIAGSAGGHFKTGRFLPWPSGTNGRDLPHNRVLASLCHAMDVPVDHFGEREYGGPLETLRG
jgi:hypothetical protein